MRANVARPWHQVLDEIARPVAWIRIVRLRGLVEGVADAHPGAADELLLDQARIESPTEFVGAVHPHHRDFAGFVVNLDFGDETSVGVAGRWRHLSGFRIDVGQGNEEDAAS